MSRRHDDRIEAQRLQLGDGVGHALRRRINRDPDAHDVAALLRTDTFPVGVHSGGAQLALQVTSARDVVDRSDLQQLG